MKKLPFEKMERASFQILDVSKMRRVKGGLACALMKTAAKGDTTHELQNTANGTDVECKLLRRGF